MRAEEIFIILSNQSTTSLIDSYDVQFKLDCLTIIKREKLNFNLASKLLAVPRSTLRSWAKKYYDGELIEGATTEKFSVVKKRESRC